MQQIYSFIKNSLLIVKGKGMRLIWKDYFFSQYWVLRKIACDVGDSFIQAGYNFKIQHFVILLFLITKPAVPQCEITRFCIKSKSTIRRSISRLVEEEMIRKRTDSKDNKKVFLELTVKGEKTFQELNKIYESVTAKMMECIPEEEQNKMSKLIECILAKMDK